MRDAVPDSGDKNHASIKRREALTGAALSTFSQTLSLAKQLYAR
jgi:hypothetical protein